MNTANLPQLIPYIISISFSLWIAAYTWRRRDTAGAVPFALTSLSQAIMTTGAVFEAMSPTIAGRLFWDNWQWVPVVFVSVGLLEFAVVFTGKNMSWRRMALIGSPLLVASLAIAADVWPSAAAQNPRIVPATPFPVLTYDYSAAMIAVSLYAIALVLVGVIVLAASFARSQGLYRQQLLLIIAGYVVPAGFGLVSVFANIDLPYGRDTLWFSVLVRNSLIIVGLFRFNLLDIIPVAHQAIFESIEDAVFVLDRAGRLVDVNPAGREFGGEQLVIGQPLPDAIFGSEEVATLLAAGKPAKTQISVRRGNPPDQRHYDARVSLLRSNRWRKQTGQLFILRDVTEQQHVAEEREKIIAELDAYAHTVAHDLKNPLSNLVGYAEMLKTLEPDDELQDSMLDHISRTSMAMGVIVEELLLFAQLQRGDEVAIGPVDTARVVEQALSRLEWEIEDSDAEIHQPDEWLPALGYAPWVEEIWANYLSNALKYGGTPPVIHVGSKPEPDGQTRFWARDNGRNMPSEFSDILASFPNESFIRAKKGHGFGLSIVKRIAERMGGRIGVEQDANGDTIFYFTLPAPPKPHPSGNKNSAPS